MEMTAERMLEVLKGYGINSRDELWKIYVEMGKLDISIFVKEWKHEEKNSCSNAGGSACHGTV